MLGQVCLMYSLAVLLLGQVFLGVLHCANSLTDRGKRRRTKMCHDQFRCRVHNSSYRIAITSSGVESAIRVTMNSSGVESTLYELPNEHEV